MLPDNLDDLFRQQLDGHATPPAPDLWARLQLPAAGTDPVDAAFQAGLGGHATPPRRELWERLEDEHLRPQPRRRRAVAWWPLSAAALLLLGLLLGGGLLWRGSYQGATGEVAQSGTRAGQHQASPLTTEEAAKNSLTQLQPAHAPGLATTSHSPAIEKKQKSFFTQATAPQSSTSSTPIATTTRPRRPAPAAQATGGQQLSRQQPDAATGSLANREGLPTLSDQPTPLPSPTPARPGDALTLAMAPTAAPEVIEVDVWRGAARPAPAAEAVVADATPAPARPRGLRLGRLLRQADHLVHGEPVSLAEATGLPETMTVQARLGGRLISKTIQL